MRTFLLSAVFTVVVSLTAFAAPPSVVLVEYHRFDASITVTRGAGKTETIELLKDTPKNSQANAERFHAVLTSLYGEGFALQSTAVSESASSQYEKVSYIFVKP
ncbi:hypothetical protein ACFST9_09685 [Hymenobacter monticola]|uniref:Uncharacterized protein n=1 Tax=Hymenobacter monticola TaxID=1705399 RepID=A0ABY4BFV2_9BACT|nr:hypothetical protein [Hymenobacter monticola]UOE35530.1 hypothetical protein MTP16_07720 [Hymenobacter monticola]